MSPPAMNSGAQPLFVIGTSLSDRASVIPPHFSELPEHFLFLSRFTECTSSAVIMILS